VSYAGEEGEGVLCWALRSLLLLLLFPPRREGKSRLVRPPLRPNSDTGTRGFVVVNPTYQVVGGSSVCPTATVSCYRMGIGIGLDG